MSVNALSNISDPYIQALLTNALTGSNATNSKTTNNTSIDSSSLTLPRDNSPQLSPFARLLTTLQQLQQSDPGKYQRVMSQIATNLQNAAKTTGGDTTRAAELTQLANDFTSASQNNTLPNIQDLAQAVGGGRGHHHHHGHVHGSPAGASNTASSGTDSSGTSADELSNAISAFLVNSISPAQSGATNPLTIISDTLTSAGVSLSQ